MGLYRIYATRVFPHFLDWGMKPLERYRGERLHYFDLDVQTCAFRRVSPGAGSRDRSL